MKWVQVVPGAIWLGLVCWVLYTRLEQTPPLETFGRYPHPIQSHPIRKDVEVWKYFKTLTHGVFVELGAHDGIENSQTRHYEVNQQWTGLLIEANPHSFARLQQSNRTATKIHGVVGPGIQEVTFLSADAAQLSTIREFSSDYHLNRLRREGGKIVETRVQMRPLQYWLDLYHLTHVHFLSLDTEGSEYEVLQTIQFNRTTFDILLIEISERRETQEPIYQFLKDRGYTRWNHPVGNQDDYYCRKEICTE